MQVHGGPFAGYTSQEVVVDLATPDTLEFVNDFLLAPVTIVDWTVEKEYGIRKNPKISLHMVQLDTHTLTSVKIKLENSDSTSVEQIIDMLIRHQQNVHYTRPVPELRFLAGSVMECAFTIHAGILRLIYAGSQFGIRLFPDISYWKIESDLVSHRTTFYFRSIVPGKDQTIKFNFVTDQIGNIITAIYNAQISNERDFRHPSADKRDMLRGYEYIIGSAV
jgi:hypothetical protein